jgi:hypothetical protein
VAAALAMNQPLLPVQGPGGSSLKAVPEVSMPIIQVLPAGLRPFEMHANRFRDRFRSDVDGSSSSNSCDCDGPPVLIIDTIKLAEEPLAPIPAPCSSTSQPTEPWCGASVGQGMILVVGGILNMRVGSLSSIMM